MNEIIIDCLTKGAAEGVARLSRLKDTDCVAGPYPYRFDSNYAQLRYRGTWNEERLDDWLFSRRFKRFEPIGTAGVEG